MLVLILIEIVLSFKYKINLLLFKKYHIPTKFLDFKMLRSENSTKRQPVTEKELG